MDHRRLISIIDGVFAVAITLLVLDLKLPSDHGGLVQGLRQMLPRFVVYLVAFASIAGYWRFHHGTFQYIAHADSKLVWLSLINLLFVTLYPLTASIVGAYPLESLATVCLSANSVLYCISSWAVWAYASANRQLLTKDVDVGDLQQIARIMLMVAVTVALAVPLALLSVYLAYADWVLVVLVSALSGMHSSDRRRRNRD